MAHTNLQHRRTHNLLLISKLLSQRDAATPFTLLLDSLEQTAKPLLREYIRRARLAKTYIIYLGFETVKAPTGVDQFIPCYNKTPEQISQVLAATIKGSVGSSTSSVKRHNLLIIDTLQPLCTLSLQQTETIQTFTLSTFLSSLITPTPSSPPTATTSLIATYHTDIPLPSTQQTNYTPNPLSLLSYLATTILTMHSLASILSTHAAQARSLAPPTYGLDEGKEGVIIGLKPARYTRHLQPEQKGMVLELEHRRKSGRGVREWYFLPSSSGSKENVVLLDDHPLLRRGGQSEGEGGGEDALTGMTFELGLTERQRVERDGVVLPYFDAQRDGGGAGPGDGGRILYDLGVEDDFDEEEDEI